MEAELAYLNWDLSVYLFFCLIVNQSSRQHLWEISHFLFAPENCDTTGLEPGSLRYRLSHRGLVAFHNSRCFAFHGSLY